MTDDTLYQLLVDAMSLVLAIQTRLAPSATLRLLGDDDMLTEAESLIERWGRYQENIH